MRALRLWQNIKPIGKASSVEWCIIAPHGKPEKSGAKKEPSRCKLLICKGAKNDSQAAYEGSILFARSSLPLWPC
jgi:hypothetical protein